MTPEPYPDLPSFVEPLGHGVYAIDTGFHRPRFDAAYLVVQEGHAVFIDTGTNRAVPRLLAALAAVGLEREAVDHVIPTHVHLDHAGGAGALMRELPRATLVVHPRGAKHMIDPSALHAGALAVYGQAEMERSYGTLVPVDPARVQTTEDGHVLQLAHRALEFVDTPGHCRHHHCIWDEASAGWFTGDTFGLSYRELDNARGEAFVVPTTTPVQFEPEALRLSIERLLEYAPHCMYLTHYGRVEGVEALAGQLLARLDDVVALGERLRHADDRHRRLKEALGDLYAERAGEHEAPADAARVKALLEMDIELNAQGMGAWLDRAERKAAVG